jgi:hypothetical protein
MDEADRPVMWQPFTSPQLPHTTLTPHFITDILGQSSRDQGTVNMKAKKETVKDIGRPWAKSSV